MDKLQEKSDRKYCFFAKIIMSLSAKNNRSLLLSDYLILAYDLQGISSASRPP
jgi:hypothetical protein